DIDIAVDLNCGAACPRELDVDNIGQRDGLEDGADFVIAVRAGVQDPQIQVDLGKGAQAGLAGLAHWLSLWGGPPGLRGSSRTRSSHTVSAISEDQQAGVDAGRKTLQKPTRQPVDSAKCG